MTLRRYTARWSTPLSRSSSKRCYSLLQQQVQHKDDDKKK